MRQFEKEIWETEKAFARLVKEKGPKTGFLAYAADDAVLHRDNRLIKGKQEIEEYFDRQRMKDIRLEWEPDFVRVSAGGDLGYTYGMYRYEGRDEKGEVIRCEGVFHSVWKREGDGEWRYVWD